MLKKIIGKLKRKRIMTWMLMWLNVSTITLNATLSLFVIYRLIFLLRNSIIFNNQREQK